MNYKIINGNNIDVLKTFPDNYFDSIVTDPPYGIDFLGKAWDANTGALETYQQCLRVLKPGGHILAFSAARTYHHLAITLEQAGFEIRDQIMWIYSSGFPKSQDVGKSIQRSLGVKKTKEIIQPKNTGMGTAYGDKTYRYKEDSVNETTINKQAVCTDPEAKAWAGWGTQLKPAHEPIALARKPIKVGSIQKNVQQWGTGALNIDATRVPYDGPTDKPVPHGGKARLAADNEGWHKNNTGWKVIEDPQINEIGRFPSNVLGEIPDYQKYFYCPKVSRRERHIGFDDPGPRHPGADGGGYQVHNVNDQVIVKGQGDNSGNNHPTVKPIELMKYLIKLVTPKGGIVLDPFNGSGSTGCAAVELGHEYVGIELDPAYVEIANKRIAAWNQDDSTFKELFE
jgi:site-specific DNA-methyltransferase (adenine-specific)